MMSDLDRQSKQYLFFRLLIVLLGFGLVAFYQVWLESSFGEHAFFYLYSLLTAYLVGAIVVLATQEQWKGRHQAMRWQVVGDFCLQFLLIWGTGGIFSLFSPLLFVTLVASTGVISARGAFLLATLATLFLTASTLAYGLGFSPISLRRGDWQLVREGSGFIYSYLFGSILALYAVSTLGSRYSHGLRRIANLHGAMLENIAEGLIAVDHDGRVVELNREGRNLLGIAENGLSFSQMTLESVFPGEKHSVLREAFRQSRRRRLETSIETANGTGKPVEVKISSVNDDNGRLRCRIGLISDLSLERDMEAAGRRIQKLEDLQVMALGIAHEIRNPLASIQGCAQELGRMVTHSPIAKRCMEIVRKESDRLDGILEEFLRFARPKTVDLVPLDLVQVIEDAAGLLKSRQDFGSRSLWLSFPPERPRIFGDRDRLTQVLLNLGLNAIEATRPEDGVITITLRKRRYATLEGRTRGRELVDGIEVEMSDNGKGLPEGDLKKLFTPFFTTKDRGNGLGLCIVNRIVREHMGALDVSSVENQGAKFCMWFPVLRQTKTTNESLESTAQEGTRREEEMEFDSHA